MKSDLVKATGTILSVGLIAAMLPWQASAAKINAMLSHESGDYGASSTYTYTGPRFEMVINPEGSNWYYGLGYRERSHDSGREYTRVNLEASYRFRFDGGWIHPCVFFQKDTALESSGSRSIHKSYETETVYIYDFDDNWGLWGEVQFGLDKASEISAKSGKLTKYYKSSYFNWEIEPGVRYSFADGSRITLSYYNSGKDSDKGDTWGFADDRYGQQVRFYYFWKTPFDLTISPYIRVPLGYAESSAWYDDTKYDETKKKSKIYRYALQLAYPVTDWLQLQGEYYLEDIKYKDGFTMGNPDSQVKYFKLGVRVDF